ncbi:MAG: alpha/beta fold hydrolase [Flavobacteriales bacterium]|nr:alpha/beta fold hydrolase [Flavobacteriales bacterium]
MRACILLHLFFASLLTSAQSVLADPHVLRDTLTLLDTTRQRSIPMALYHRADEPLDGRPVILFSHGYNENKPGTYLLYRWLLDALVKDGYVVVSVQHELPGDEPLAMKGDIRAARMPSWQRGVANLEHVLRHLHRSCPQLAFDHLTVMGHSQGGDISVLFATTHPEAVQKLITLDNLRLALPRTDHPRVYSLRSNDQPADPGVLPTDEEAADHHIAVVRSKDIGHNGMGSRGTPEQQVWVLGLVRGWLGE